MDGARAIVDPVRREILQLLHASSLSAGQIAEHFSISRPAVSRHLRVLAECGVVTVTTVGRRRIYGLRTAPLLAVAAYLDRLLAPPLTRQLDALATEVARTRRERRTAERTPLSGNGSETNREKRA